MCHRAGFLNELGRNGSVDTTVSELARAADKLNRAAEGFGNLDIGKGNVGDSLRLEKLHRDELAVGKSREDRDLAERVGALKLFQQNQCWKMFSS